MKKAGQPQTNRLSHRPLFHGAIFLFSYNRSAGTAPQDKCTILFYQEIPIAFIS